MQGKQHADLKNVIIQTEPFLFFREALTSRTNHKKFPSLLELAATCIWTRKKLLIDTADNPFNAIRKTANNFGFIYYHC
jgi:hypothetical protein